MSNSDIYSQETLSPYQPLTPFKKFHWLIFIILIYSSRPFITRYSELECLHRQLIARYPELKTESVFPRKRFWGHYSPSVLKKRADQFSCYFHHLINARNCIYRQASIFRDFFISEQASRVDYV